jgi:peptide chain release factor subunit 1
MAIDYVQIERLLNHHSSQHPVISLYLTVTPPRDFTTELRSMVHAATTELEQRKEYSEDQLRELDRLLDTLEDHVRNVASHEGTRLLVIFSSTDGLWQEFRLPVALPSQMVVEATPYVRPLATLLDEFDRYCVVVTDSSKARIFSLYMGDFEEHPDVFIQSEVPDRVNVKISMTGDPATGVRGGLGAQRIQRHIKDHIHRHLKSVAGQTFNIFRGKRFDRLIVAGPEDNLIPWFHDHPHSYLKERLAGDFRAHPEDNEKELQEKALHVAQEAERFHEEQVIEQLMDQQGPGGKAVLGTEPTVEALLLGQVHTLVIRHDFRAKGYTCPSGHILSTYLKTCPLCGQPTQETQDLGEEMVEEALSQSAEIEHVFAEHEDFDSHGVGALLRFTL